MASLQGSFFCIFKQASCVPNAQCHLKLQWYSVSDRRVIGLFLTTIYINARFFLEKFGTVTSKG